MNFCKWQVVLQELWMDRQIWNCISFRMVIYNFLSMLYSIHKVRKHRMTKLGQGVEVRAHYPINQNSRPISGPILFTTFKVESTCATNAGYELCIASHFSYTRWPVKHDRVFLYLVKSDLDPVYLLYTYTIDKSLFKMYQLNTAMFNRSPCRFII